MQKNSQSFLAVTITLLPSLLLIYFLSKPYEPWQNVDFHYYSVGFSSILALVVGVFAYFEYKRMNHYKIYFLAVGFIGVAILYAFHGLITPGKSIVSFVSMKQHINSFVFFGDMSRLWVSLFFIPQTLVNNSRNLNIHWISLVGIAILLLSFSVLMLMYPESFPNIKHENGQDTYFAIIVKVLTTIFLVITAVRYYEAWRIIRNVPLLALIIGSALLAQTPIIFMLSKPWGSAWWLAHNVYLLSFIIIGLGLLYSLKYEKIHFFDIGSILEERMHTIEAQKKEMEELAQELVLANMELEKIAFYDSLTGALNRRRFGELAQVEKDRAVRYKQPLSLIIIDIDRFKNINDKYGHNTGDLFLIELVKIINSGLRKSDVLARWGGEEFVILTPNQKLVDAVEIANRIRVKIERSEIIEKEKITVSMGVSEFLEVDDLESCIKRADIALYKAKADGRNRVVSEKECEKESEVMVKK